jgi:mannan endo-1,4-beta-mannosidase
MLEEMGRYWLGRRSFLRTAVTIGLGATCTAFVSPATSALPPIAEYTSKFVSTTGTNFMSQGGSFYFVGTNNYYLHYASHFMIDDVLKDVAAMGLQIVRMWGFLDGAPKDGFVMQPAPGVYPEDGYERFDYTVWRARQLGIKLVVTLVNNWNDFGGMNQYVAWFGGNNHDEFYTNEKIKTAYKQYIQHFLQRRNRYSGTQMIDEPTIMTWELANEPQCQSDTTGETLVNWVQEISSFIKSIDSQHLVCVGDEGWYNEAGNPDWTRSGQNGVDWMRLITLPTIDYGTVHLYPDYWHQDNAWSLQWITDHIRDGHSVNKPVVLEEYSWHGMKTRDAIYRSWTDIIYQEGGNGDQFWLLTGLQDNGTLYPNYDGFRVTYPSSTASVFSAHAAQMKAKYGS